MIIKRMRATFGQLEDRELELQPGLNLITGDNETGKSTWLAFLLAIPLTLFFFVRILRSKGNN